MKKSLYFLSAVLVALLTASCSAEADQQIQTYSPATVTVEVPGSLSIGVDVYSVDFEIKSTTTWSIKNIPSWMKASMSGGTNDQTITFTVEANPSCTDQRIDTFRVTAADLSLPVAVIQEPATEHLYVIDDNGKDTPEEFSSDGGTYTFYIYNNSSWSISASESWVSMSETSGSADREITLTVENSPVEEVRTATVNIVTSTASKAVTMEIRQAALIKPNPGEGDNPTPDL